MIYICPKLIGPKQFEPVKDNLELFGPIEAGQRTRKKLPRAFLDFSELEKRSKNSQPIFT